MAHGASNYKNIGTFIFHTPIKILDIVSTTMFLTLSVTGGDKFAENISKSAENISTSADHIGKYAEYMYW